MKKVRVYAFIGYFFISAGATLIHIGFGLIIMGVMALVVSYVEHESITEAEPTEQLDIWHDLTETPPSDSGIIILRDSTDDVLDSYLMCYWSAPQNKLRNSNDDFYEWGVLHKYYEFDKWCYMEDLINDDNEK